MTTKHEQQLQQQWQQYVATEAEHVELEFPLQRTTQFEKRIKPMWLTAVAFVMAIAVTWWLSFLPVPESSEASIAGAPASPSNEIAPMLLAANYRLDSIERRIQQAYLQGASDAELQQLWQQHQALAD